MSASVLRRAGTIQHMALCHFRQRRAFSTVRRPPTSFPLFQVDSFSSQPFSGNPAAVCLLPHGTGRDGGWPLTDHELLQISAENNLSETAFIVPQTPETKEESLSAFEKGQHFNLRWFTPTTEVDLCGHATLAAAAVLVKECNNKSETLHFNTKSGELVASTVADSIELDFPVNIPLPLKGEEYEVMKPFLESLAPQSSTDSDFTVEKVLYSAKTKKLVVVVPSELGRAAYLESLDGLRVAKDLFSVDQSGVAFSDLAVKGVIVTMQDKSGNYDFLSRYFAPWVGIDEDPVTGSAHTVIAPMWANALSRDNLKARQCSPRGGDLDLRLDWSQRRLQIKGDAFVCIKGKLCLG